MSIARSLSRPAAAVLQALWDARTGSQPSRMAVREYG